MGLIWEKSFLEFLIITVVLGGGAASMAGRELALGWRPYWKLIWFMLLLGLAVRFTHFALVQGTLVAGLVPLAGPVKLPLPPKYYFVDTLVLLALASLSYRLTRVRQMVTQYPWLFRRDGWLWWVQR